MKLRFLGTGTSTGVPMIGCHCPVCTSTDAHDKRWRTSALIETERGTRLLIDCGPDFREQMLQTTFAPIHGVLITHEHYDHVGGIDDLRPFCTFGSINIYGEDHCLAQIRASMPYCFVEHKYPGVPDLHLTAIVAGQPFFVREQEVVPVQIMHGKLPIIGYRIGQMAYITDMKSLPENATQVKVQLKGIDTLVVNGLRYTPHGSHQTIPEAIAFSRDLGARETYLIHLCHRAGRHADLERQMPTGVHVAYDGLEIYV